MAPISAALFGQSEIFATSLDHHHSFVVHYANQVGGLWRTCTRSTLEYLPEKVHQH